MISGDGYIFIVDTPIWIYSLIASLLLVLVMWLTGRKMIR